jgi:hypothetical protein
MATKTSILYSTNPKMDGSGITARQPRSEELETKRGSKEVPLAPRIITGGMLYKKGLMEQENFRKDKTITRPEMLRQGAQMVNQGTSPKYAMDILEEKVEAKDRNNYDSCKYWE